MESQAQPSVVRDTLEMHGLAAARALGPLLIGERHIVRRDRETGIASPPPALPDMMILLLPMGHPAHLHAGETRQRCPPGGAMLLDTTQRWTIDGGRGVHCYAVIMPRVFLALAAPGGVIPGVLPRTPGLAAIRTFLAGMLALEAALTPREELLAVGALQYLLAAAFTPLAMPDRAPALRGAGLLQRITAQIDRDLAATLSAPSLCAALGCSRSALYRAASPAGGIAELVARRRLAAVYGCLIDARDRRAIATIAVAHGFSDAAQFSRRFRRTFGTTARQLRNANATAGHGTRTIATAVSVRAASPSFTGA